MIVFVFRSSQTAKETFTKNKKEEIAVDEDALKAKKVDETDAAKPQTGDADGNVQTNPYENDSIFYRIFATFFLSFWLIFFFTQFLNEAHRCFFLNFVFCPS